MRKDFLDILACPKCKGDIVEKGMFLTCGRCNLAFPILDGDVPNFLLDEAWELKKAEKSSFRHDLKL
jgi:uncharacterized protein YbaR (Trm112 family)